MPLLQESANLEKSLYRFGGLCQYHFDRQLNVNSPEKCSQAVGGRVSP
jgi:hypothetical protein